MKSVVLLSLLALTIVLTPTAFAQTNDQIPGWVKGVFSFWLDGGISDAELVSSIQFLVNDGIIELSTNSTQTVDDTDKDRQIANLEQTNQKLEKELELHKIGNVARIQSYKVLDLEKQIKEKDEKIMDLLDELDHFDRVDDVHDDDRKDDDHHDDDDRKDDDRRDDDHDEDRRDDHDDDDDRRDDDDKDDDRKDDHDDDDDDRDDDRN